MTPNSYPHFAMHVLYQRISDRKYFSYMLKKLKEIRIRELFLCPQTSPTDVFLSDKEMDVRLKVIKDAIKITREEGFMPGIAPIAVLGHAGKSWMPFPPEIGPDGKKYPSRACHLSVKYQKYIKRFLSGIASLSPEKIMLDDDFRSTGCYCNHHMKEFLRRFGYRLNREKLVRILKKEPQGKDIKLRQAWYDFKRGTMMELAVEIEKTIHSINPEIEIGLMQGGLYFSQQEGRDISSMLRTIAGPGRQPFIRTAGSMYFDTHPDYHCDCVELGLLMRSLLPQDVVVYSENTIRYPGGKSSENVKRELLMQFAMGWKNIFFAIDPISFTDNPHIFKMLKDNQNLFRTIANTIPERPEFAGVPIIYPDIKPGLNCPFGREPSHVPYTRPFALSGIPVYGRYLRQTNSSDKALVFLEESTKDELKELSHIIKEGKSVFLSPEVAESLLRMDSCFKKILGISDIHSSQSAIPYREDFMKDALNGEGARRTLYLDMRIEDLVGLKVNKENRVLSIIRDKDDKDIGPGVVLSYRKGRIAFCAYKFRTSQWYSVEHVVQLRGVTDWLVSGRLPILCESFKIQTKIIKLSPDKLAIILINHTYEKNPAGYLRINIEGKEKYLLKQLDTNGRFKVLPANRKRTYWKREEMRQIPLSTIKLERLGVTLLLLESTVGD